MIRQARELRARGEHPECTKMRFCLFGCMHGKKTCQLTPPTSPRVQVSKFKQAYEERKKAAGKSSAGSLFAFGDVAKAALEASHGAGRATLSSVATQALNAQHGEPSAASAAAPKGEIVKGAIGPTAAASPRASRYDGGSIQDRQSMFGGARRASLSATSVLGCAAAPPAAAAFAACAPVSEADVVDEQGVAQNALRKTSGRGLKSRGGASSPKAAKPSRPSARKIHRACGNVVPEAL